MMRVITGIARGKKLNTLDGMATRPTAERVKEAVFSSLSDKVCGAKVLDLFAGSGQMGIEAISRGALFCTFVERSDKAVRVIRDNVKICGFNEKSVISDKNVESFIQQSKEKFDLIFMDPPYGKDMVNQTVSLICCAGILAESGVIIAESDTPDEVRETFGKLVIYKTAKYGRTVIRYYKNDGE